MKIIWASSARFSEKLSIVTEYFDLIQGALERKAFAEAGIDKLAIQEQSTSQQQQSVTLKQKVTNVSNENVEVDVEWREHHVWSLTQFYSVDFSK